MGVDFGNISDTLVAFLSTQINTQASSGDQVFGRVVPLYCKCEMLSKCQCGRSLFCLTVGNSEGLCE